MSIGKPVVRKEASAKVSGRAIYVDDLTFDGMLHGTTVRSSHPKGKIRGIHLPQDIPGLTVVTAEDIADRNAILLYDPDQPCLASDSIRHSEEPIVLLAHQDPHELERARQQVRIDVAAEAPCLTLEDALSGQNKVWGDDNILKEIVIDKGEEDLDKVFAEASLVVEGSYETGAQEQMYIEPQGMIARWSDSEGVTIWGSMQCPYYIQKALCYLFDLPPAKVRIIQCETGGGFGGKEEYPSMLAAHAALLAKKSERPVKMIYRRDEDLVATTKRHPSWTKVRSAHDAEGKLLALDIDFVIDGGAYLTLSNVVLSRGTIHAAGPYDCARVRVRGRAVATNHPPHGAFRGFGAPQSIFAIERHWNRVARKLGQNPDEVRRRHFLAEGRQTATSQVVKDKVDMNALMNEALAASGYQEKVGAFPKANASRTVKKGIGFATFMHGAGFTGSGEKHLASEVALEADADGHVTVLAASTEIGQGTKTVFSQIASESLGIPYESISVAQPDTGHVPDSGPTVASRTCMVVGKLIQSAADSLLHRLQDFGLGDQESTRDFAGACRRYFQNHQQLRVSAKYTPPAEINWDDKAYRGDAYATYAWATYVAEVSVDMVTYQTTVDDFWALQEVGKVVHPVLAAGQIEGGVVQGIGFALYEKVVWKEGRMANGSMTNYIIPTSEDIPNIRVMFQESPAPFGPKGAKGIGELPMDGAGPAIANAIEHAIGKPVDRIPCLPEDLMMICEGT